MREVRCGLVAVDDRAGARDLRTLVAVVRREAGTETAASSGHGHRLVEAEQATLDHGVIAFANGAGKMAL